MSLALESGFKITQKIAKKMLEENIYVIGFSYPVVPHNQARIRVQISASHTKDQIAKCIEALCITIEKVYY